MVHRLTRRAAEAHALTPYPKTTGRIRQGLSASCVIYYVYPGKDMAMQVRVSRWGNSLAVRLPKAVAEDLRLEEGQAVELVVESGAIKLRPKETAPRYRLEELVAEMDRLGPERAPPYEEWGILPSEWPDDGEQGGGTRETGGR